MEAFLISFTPISAINIFTALFKRVEFGESTDDCNKEKENFVKTLNTALTVIKDSERLKKLHDFRTGKVLEQR
ncbi:3999_t:CDS:1, partial [Entrophospora sp. SA101]